MSNLFVDLYSLWQAAYSRKALVSFDQLSSAMLLLIANLDAYLASHESFLLGRWLQGAQDWATSDSERALYEYNARNQITLWGPDGQIEDYAAKNWAGLLGGYYSQRWQLLIKSLSAALEGGFEFDQEVYDAAELQIGKSFCEDLSPFPTGPIGHTYELSTTMQALYGATYESAYDVYSDMDVPGMNLLEQGAWTKVNPF